MTRSNKSITLLPAPATPLPPPTFRETGPMFKLNPCAFGFGAAIVGCEVEEKENEASRVISRKLDAVKTLTCDQNMHDGAPSK